MAKRPYFLLSLIQSGETTWEREGRMHGLTDLPLSDDGRAAVSSDIACLDGVPLSVVFHPPDEAATETASLVAKLTGAKAKPVEDLHEPDLGLLEGLLDHEFAERHAKRAKQWEDDPLSFQPPEGEPIVTARDRVFRAMTKLLKKSRVEEAAFVLHPIALGLTRCWLCQRPEEEMHELARVRPRVERFVLAAPLVDELRDEVSAA